MRTSFRLPLASLRRLCPHVALAAAVEERPRQVAPPGWESHESVSRTYYCCLYDDASVWVDPYVLREALAQELPRLLPAVWSHQE